MTENYDQYASVTDMLRYPQWDTLENRRNNFRIIAMYKNNMVDINPRGLIQPTSTVTRDHLMKFQKLQTNVAIDAFKYSFYPSAIRLWSNLPLNLPNEVVISPGLESLKNKLNM